MRKIILAGLFLMIASSAFNHAKAEEASTMGTMDAQVDNVFTLEFYTDANILYSTTIPFTNIDPARPLCYPDGRQANDGKSDVGLLCKSNMGVPWYLKINGSNFLPPPFSSTHFKYYLGQPWNNNTSSQADGTLAQSPGWYDMPASSSLVYAAGIADEINTPYGTLAMFSFAVNPRGLTSKATYSCIITYTLTTTP